MCRDSPHLHHHLAANRFVMRTDVKSYYASIDHIALMDRLGRHIDDRAILNLLGQYMRRTAERGGWFWDYERGISLGCPLSSRRTIALPMKRCAWMVTGAKGVRYR